MFPLSLVTAAALLVVWFPLSTLWHQQSEIDAASSQIASIAKQSQDLKDQARSVSSRSAEEMLARSQYQLVSPGQSLIQVLPGDGAGYVTTGAGDPGLQPLVAPLSLTSLNAAAATTSAHSSSHGSFSSFVSRFVRTLEFWR
jgi:hypothetical protein